ncbi:MAG: class I SAM-dependent methyltransferase [Deltaproteobacteria bacterium]|nr:class I SAM-dependent methyltransferase [Deltaproteobacteria bacterium]MBI3294820.1 class I SAM-dependent methyltransferase [Deltaproteobacteria bacterium]
MPDHSSDLYIDLLKKSLTNWLYADTEWHPIGREGSLRRRFSQGLSWLLRRPVQVLQKRPYNPEERKNGLDWPPYAHTMVGLSRLDQLQTCIDTVLRENIPGDFIETGVWRGGTVIFMRAVLKARGVSDRKIWAADSFAGLPPPSGKYEADQGDQHFTFSELAVSLEEVKNNFRKYGLLDEQIVFLKGWFSETLPTAPIQNLAIARLDGDMYESTIDALNALYEKVSPGGFLIVDDYAIPGCRKAIHDYRNTHGIIETIVPIDGSAVYWRKKL